MQNDSKASRAASGKMEKKKKKVANNMSRITDT